MRRIDLSAIHEHIPILHQVIKIDQIHKGYSFDSKYFLYESNESPAYVMRTAAFQQTKRKRSEFDTLHRVYGHGVLTSEPIDFGTIESMDVCYMVVRYVEGEEASELLPALSSDEQFRIGTTAGRELRLMHQLDAPIELEPWHIRRIAKHKRQFADYLNCGVKLPEEAAIISFVEENLTQMLDRPNRFQHDDFHPANLLIHNRIYAGAIDYNRYDWGDPLHDFIKIAYFSREVSIPFSIGQIDGYFDGKVPERFWKLYALYTALIICPTISWTLQVVPDRLEDMMVRIRLVLDDHQNFESIVPSWYKP